MISVSSSVLQVLFCLLIEVISAIFSFIPAFFKGSSGIMFCWVESSVLKR